MNITIKLKKPKEGNSTQHINFDINKLRKNPGNLENNEQIGNGRIL